MADTSTPAAQTSKNSEREADKPAEVTGNGLDARGAPASRTGASQPAQQVISAIAEEGVSTDPEAVASVAPAQNVPPAIVPAAPSVNGPGEQVVREPQKRQDEASHTSLPVQQETAGSSHNAGATAGTAPAADTAPADVQPGQQGAAAPDGTERTEPPSPLDAGSDAAAPDGPGTLPAAVRRAVDSDTALQAVKAPAAVSTPAAPGQVAPLPEAPRFDFKRAPRKPKTPGPAAAASTQGLSGSKGSAAQDEATSSAAAGAEPQAAPAGAAGISDSRTAPTTQQTAAAAKATLPPPAVSASSFADTTGGSSPARTAAPQSAQAGAAGAEPAAAVAEAAAGEAAAAATAQERKASASPPASEPAEAVPAAPTTASPDLGVEAAAAQPAAAAAAPEVDSASMPPGSSPTATLSLAAASPSPPPPPPQSSPQLSLKSLGAGKEPEAEVAAPTSPAAMSPGPPAAGTASEQPSTPSASSEGLSRQTSALAARIAALKSQDNGGISSPQTPATAAQVTPGSVKERADSIKRSSFTRTPASSPPPSPQFKWRVNSQGTTARGASNGPPAVGEVVAESTQSADKLKGFWEERTPPPDAERQSFTNSASHSGNHGRKWTVKLNVPLANGKVSDLSFFKPKEPPKPPPPVEYEHRIGDVYFSLEKLRGMTGADGIDPSQKELYLNDEDFAAAFVSDKDSYGEKPKWRQILLKKKVGLF